MPRRSLKSQVAEWRKLCAAAEIHEIEIPSLGPFRAALEEALEEIAVSKSRQVNFEAKRKEATQELHDSRASGQEYAVQLKSYVRASFGRRDDRLGAFGMKSLGRPRRKPPELERTNGSPGYH